MLAAAVAVLLTGGCLIMSGQSSHQSGIKVSDSTLRQIEVGTTTKSWLIATLGEPSRHTTVEGKENVELLVYEHTVHESSGGSVRGDAVLDGEVGREGLGVRS
jgi:hypothetical protein